MASEDTVEILRRTPVLGAFELDAMRVIANVADTRRLRPREALFRQGDRSDGGYVVLSGRLAVGRAGGGRQTGLGPGSLIGRSALFVRTERPASAMAEEPSSVLRISPTLMKRVLNEYPAAAAAMYDALAADLALTGEELAEAGRFFAGLEPAAP